MGLVKAVGTFTRDLWDALIGNLALLVPLLRNRRSIIINPTKALIEGELPSAKRFATEIFLIGTAAYALVAFFLTLPRSHAPESTLEEQIWSRFDEAFAACWGPLSLMFYGWLVGYGFLVNRPEHERKSIAFPAEKICIYLVPALGFWSYLAGQIVLNLLINGSYRYPWVNDWILWILLIVVLWSYLNVRSISNRICILYEQAASVDNIVTWDLNPRFVDGIIFASSVCVQITTVMLIAVSLSILDEITPMLIRLSHALGGMGLR